MTIKKILLLGVLAIATGILAQEQTQIPDNNGKSAVTKDTAEDLTITQTPEYIYVSVRTWPDDRIVCIKALGKDSRLYPKKMKLVELEGYGMVSFMRCCDELKVYLPRKIAGMAIPVLKIKK